MYLVMWCCLTSKSSRVTSTTHDFVAAPNASVQDNDADGNPPRNIFESHAELCVSSLDTLQNPCGVYTDEVAGFVERKDWYYENFDDSSTAHPSDDKCCINMHGIESVGLTGDNACVKRANSWVDGLGSPEHDGSHEYGVEGYTCHGEEQVQIEGLWGVDCVLVCVLAQSVYNLSASSVYEREWSNLFLLIWVQGAVVEEYGHDWDSYPPAADIEREEFVGTTTQYCCNDEHTYGEVLEEVEDDDDCSPCDNAVFAMPPDSFMPEDNYSLKGSTDRTSTAPTQEHKPDRAKSTGSLLRRTPSTYNLTDTIDSDNDDDDDNDPYEISLSVTCSLPIKKAKSLGDVGGYKGVQYNR